MFALHGARAYGLARMRVIAAIKERDEHERRHWNAIPQFKLTLFGSYQLPRMDSPHEDEI